MCPLLVEQVTLLDDVLLNGEMQTGNVSLTFLHRMLAGAG